MLMVQFSNRCTYISSPFTLTMFLTEKG